MKHPDPSDNRSASDAMATGPDGSSQRRRSADAIGRLEAWTRSRSEAARWGFVLVWYGLIFALTQAPGTDNEATYALLDLASLGSLIGLARIAAHLVVFGVLSLG